MAHRMWFTKKQSLTVLLIFKRLLKPLTYFFFKNSRLNLNALGRLKRESSSLHFISEYLLIIQLSLAQYKLIKSALKGNA